LSQKCRDKALPCLALLPETYLAILSGLICYYYLGLACRYHQRFVWPYYLEKNRYPEKKRDKAVPCLYWWLSDK
jgi:hypothetical protein